MSNKVATVGKVIKELRIHFCQTSPASKGLRDFVGKSYPELKKTYPQLPILIREARGVEARAFGRFEKGQETKINLDNLPSEQVKAKIQQLISH